MASDKSKLWFFVDHNGIYRYVYSLHKPQKFFVFDKELDHIEEIEAYHGSMTITRNYYRYSDKKIYYWSFEPKKRYTGLTTTDLTYFEPDIIGTPVLKVLLKNEYLDMTFDDEPIELPINNETDILYFE